MTIPQDLAWRELFTRGIAPDQAQMQVSVEGHHATVEAILKMVSILA